jgi:hypothetical protein
MPTSYFIETIRNSAGNARYWLAQVSQGFRPHVDGKDNTAAFKAHYERQLAECEAILAHA